MLDGRRQKDRQSPGQFENKGNTDNRNKLHRNEGNTRIPNLIVGLAKVNSSTRIPKKVNLRSNVVPSSSLCTITSTTTTKESDVTSEILIRAQAKTLEAINKITNRVDKLEHRIEDIYRKVKLIDRLNTTKDERREGGRIKKGESSFSSGITPNILSDESSDELSRTTNGTGQEDDELLSLLNQITKFFDSVKQSKQSTNQPNCHIQSSSIPRPDFYLHQQPQLPTHQLVHNHLVTSTETGSLGFGLTGHGTKSTLLPFKQSNHNTIGSMRHHHQQSSSPAIRKKLFSSMDHSRQIDCPTDSTSSPQSFRALIFESNVEHFLANLDCGHYHPPSMSTTTLMSNNHQHQHHQLVKSHPIIGSRLATGTINHQPHKQPDQR